MKWLASILAVTAVAAFAVTADVSPYAGKPVVGGNDAWGQMIYSWSLPYSSAYRTGAAWMSDNNMLFGQWSSNTSWLRYLWTGTTASANNSYSFSTNARDCTGRNHLSPGNNSPGYFVAATGGPGPAVAVYYTPSGATFTLTLGSTVISSVGRGIAWNGTYYYATTGSWSSPIGVYTTTGSQLSTVSGIDATTLGGLYGIAMHVNYPQYLITWDQGSGNPVKEWLLTAYNQAQSTPIRSFTTPGMAGGIDAAWSNGYLVLGCQNGYGYIYDGQLGMTTVTPESVGKIKALYR